MEVNYKIVYTRKSLKDLEQWNKSGNKSAQSKISELITSIENTPNAGPGSPEQLKYLPGIWSRRINKGDRIVYEIIEETKEIIIYQIGGHYGDK